MQETLGVKLSTHFPVCVGVDSTIKQDLENDKGTNARNIVGLVNDNMNWWNLI